MQAELVEHNNDDLSVANIARVSFNNWNDTMHPKDPGLIQYLAKHLHKSPFFHQRFTFAVHFNEWVNVLVNAKPEDLMGCVWERGAVHFKVRHSFYGWVNLVKKSLLADTQETEFKVLATLADFMPYSLDAYGLTYASEPKDHTIDYANPRFIDVSLRLNVPIFVARQFFTHRMFATNEVSRRYVTAEPEFFVPDEWRSKPDGSIKQGSGQPLDDNTQARAIDRYLRLSERSLDCYEGLLSDEVAPEQARMSLPQSMYTQIIATGSLYDWAQTFKLRIESNAQKEVRDLFESIEEQMPHKHLSEWVELIK